MIAPSRTITAPTGTSLRLPASRATSSALRMYCSSPATDDEPNTLTPRALSACNRGLGGFAERQLATRIAIDDDVIALGETAFEHRQGERVLQQALNRALQRSRTKRRIVAFGRQHFR